MSAIDPLVEANRTFAQDFSTGGLPGTPVRRVAVVTCMDCRIDAGRALGVTVGDANVIRNAGGLSSRTPSGPWRSASASSAPML